jgi:hypothetical protein
LEGSMVRNFLMAVALFGAFALTGVVAQPLAAQ